MTKLTVDPATQNKLRTVAESVELCDDSGHTLGYFTPATDTMQYAGLKSPNSTAELLRRAKQGGGRTLAEILNDLEKKA